MKFFNRSSLTPVGWPPKGIEEQRGTSRGSAVTSYEHIKILSTVDRESPETYAQTMNPLPYGPPAKLLVDTDTGVDDAAALLLLSAQDIEIVGVTTVHGNVPQEQATANALYALEVGGATDVPVFPGCRQPLVAPLRTAEWIHGPDGFGGSFFPLAKRRPETEHAVQAIVRLAHENAGELTLLTLGPLTNVAAAIASDPSIVDCFSSVVAMAGSADLPGNTTAVAEYNVVVDPEAAAAVFEAGLPLVMVGYDISRKRGVMHRADRERLANSEAPPAQFLRRITGHLERFSLEVLKQDGYDLADAITAAVTAAPSLATVAPEVWIGIELSGRYTRAMTVVDHLGLEEKPHNAHVVLDVDEQAYKELLFASLGADPVASGAS
ncbi:MAG: nucleoside hydrolase [Solirubrobacterales bacterium]